MAYWWRSIRGGADVTILCSACHANANDRKFDGLRLQVLYRNKKLMFCNLQCLKQYFYGG